MLDLVFERKIALTHNVTPLLSVVVGLLLVFRNGSAYSRWDDGRKQWAKMVRSPAYVLTAAPSILHSRTSGRTGIIQLDTHMEQMSISRSLTRTIWIHVAAGSPSHGLNGGHRLPAENGPNLFVKAQNDQHDKVSAARLVVAFLVATKHHIRREYGVNWPGEWERRPGQSALSCHESLTGIQNRPWPHPGKQGVRTAASPSPNSMDALDSFDLLKLFLSNQTPNLERLAAATGSGWGAAGGTSLYLSPQRHESVSEPRR